MHVERCVCPWKRVTTGDFLSLAKSYHLHGVDIQKKGDHYARHVQKLFSSNCKELGNRMRGGTQRLGVRWEPRVGPGSRERGRNCLFVNF